jgi:hypothetical protein
MALWVGRISERLREGMDLGIAVAAVDFVLVALGLAWVVVG